MARTTFDEKRAPAKTKSAEKAEDVTDKTSADSGALQWDGQLTSQRLYNVMEEKRFVKDNVFNKLEDLHEPETSSLLHQNVNRRWPVSHKTLASADFQASSANDVLCKVEIVNAKRIVSIIMAVGAHEHILSFNLLFFRPNNSFC